MDRLIDWIDRLPGPSALFYIALYLVAVAAVHVAQWVDGVLSGGRLSGELFAVGLWFVLGLGMVHVFERATGSALEAFEPAFEERTESFADLRFRMTEMPARTVLVLTIVVALGLGAAVLSQPGNVYAGLEHPVSVSIMVLFTSIAYGFAAVLFYVVARTLVMVRSAYRDLPSVDPLRQRPLYALSNLTMKVGLFLLVIANVNLGTHFLAAEPEAVSPDLVLGLAGLVMAITAFVLPLWGVHSRLQEAKAVLLEESAATVDGIRIRLYGALENDDHDRVDALGRGLSSVVTIEERLRDIATWPWQPGTFRNFLTAVVLPILVWSTQQVLVGLF